MQNIWKNSKKEILFIGIFLILGAAMLIWIYGSKQETCMVLVQVDGEEIQSFSLSKSTTYEINGTEGTNLLHIENGSAWLEDADCPDQICVNTGKIKYAGRVSFACRIKW